MTQAPPWNLPVPSVSGKGQGRISPQTGNRSTEKLGKLQVSMGTRTKASLRHRTEEKKKESEKHSLILSWLSEPRTAFKCIFLTLLEVRTPDLYILIYILWPGVWFRLLGQSLVEPVAYQLCGPG